MALQRLRVKYGRTGELQYIAHLDMLRLWQRMLRRAEIGVALSEGHPPRPRLSIAAALPLGVTSECELLDVYLKRRLSPFYFLKKVSQQAPPTLQLFAANDLPLDWPSLQSQVRSAEYRVGVETTETIAAAQAAAEALLAKATLPWEHQRDKEVRKYDLRQLIEALRVETGPPGELTVWMRLRTDPNASGRPEQVVAALELPPPAWMHRTKLVLAERQPAAQPALVHG